MPYLLPIMFIADINLAEKLITLQIGLLHYDESDYIYLNFFDHGIE
jgi:hypothetical protein